MPFGSGGASVSAPLTLRAPVGLPNVLRILDSNGNQIWDFNTNTPEFASTTSALASLGTIDGQLIESLPAEDTFPALAVYPAVARTKDALQVQNSGGAILARILAAGALVTAQHAAPADADLAAGDVALWFDQTNGAGNTKLMVKGKSADGTVKTASVVLA